MTIKLPDVPLERPASNERSPNRKPRTRRLNRQAVATAQKNDFLKALQAGLPVAEIVKRQRLAEWTVNSWREKDPRFKAAMEEAKRVRAEVTESLRVPSVDDRVYEKALKGDMKAAVPFLRAHWPEVYGDRQQIEHSGVVVTITGDELARIFRESRSAFLQAGGEPLGLADGGGDGERPAARSRDDEVPAVAAPAPSASGNRRKR